MRWRSDDAASATLVGFIVATSVFAIAFTAVTYFASEKLQSPESHDPALDAKAAAAALALVSSPGGPDDWQLTYVNGVVPAPERWGLLQEGSSQTLDGTKVALLYEWNHNDYYADLKEALGIHDGEMRFRLYPNLADPGEDVPGLGEHRVAYVGEWDADYDNPIGPDGNWAGGPTGYVVEEMGLLDATGVDFTASGVDDDFTLGYTEGDAYRDTRAQLAGQLALRIHGFLAAEDKTQLSGAETYWKVVDLDGADLDGQAGLEVPAYGNSASDPIDPPGSDNVVLTLSKLDAGTWKYGRTDNGIDSERDRIILGEFDFQGVGSGDAANLVLEHYVAGDQPAEPLELDQTDDFAIVEWWCTSCIGTVVWDVAGEWRNVGNPDGFATTTLDLTPVVSPSGLGEKGYLALSWRANDANTNDGWFISDLELKATIDGQTSTLWENTIDGTTSGSVYDAIVFGSQTAHASFIDAADPVFEHALEPWMDAGGDILVLGSSAANDGWLDALGQNIEPGVVGGQMYAEGSDPLHAILNNPNHLRYTTYWASQQSFLIDPDDPNWNMVVIDDQQKAVMLAINNGRWSYDGTAILAAYQPYRMGPKEGEAFFTNMLAYARYTSLEADFGATVPAGMDVGSSSRTVVLDATPWGLGNVEADVTLYVWG